MIITRFPAFFYTSVLLLCGSALHAQRLNFTPYQIAGGSHNAVGVVIGNDDSVRAIWTTTGPRPPMELRGNRKGLKIELTRFATKDYSLAFFRGEVTHKGKTFTGAWYRPEGSTVTILDDKPIELIRVDTLAKFAGQRKLTRDNRNSYFPVSMLTEQWHVDAGSRNLNAAINDLSRLESTALEVSISMSPHKYNKAVLKWLRRQAVDSDTKSSLSNVRNIYYRQQGFPIGFLPDIICFRQEFNYNSGKVNGEVNILHAINWDLRADKLILLKDIIQRNALDTFQALCVRKARHTMQLLENDTALTLNTYFPTGYYLPSTFMLMPDGIRMHYNAVELQTPWLKDVSFFLSATEVIPMIDTRTDLGARLSEYWAQRERKLEGATKPKPKENSKAKKKAKKRK